MYMIILCVLGNFACFFVISADFKKKKSNMNTISVSHNSVEDPEGVQSRVRSNPAPHPPFLNIL